MIACLTSASNATHSASILECDYGAMNATARTSWVPGGNGCDSSNAQLPGTLGKPAVGTLWSIIRKCTSALRPLLCLSPFAGVPGTTKAPAGGPSSPVSKLTFATPPPARSPAAITPAAWYPAASPGPKSAPGVQGWVEQCSGWLKTNHQIV